MNISGPAAVAKPEMLFYAPGDLTVTMVLSDWKVEKGKITLRGWFSATLKLQQGDAETIENGTGSITTKDKSFAFSITLDDDFKIAKDKETQKEIVEIKLQGA